MIENHIAILPVLLPLLLAVIATASPERFSRIITPLAPFACFIVMLMCVASASEGAISTYNVGGWVAPIGIALRIDALTVFMLLMVNFSAAATFVYNRDSNHPLMLLALAGLNGMLVTRDLFNIYVFLEISALASYVLIAGGRHRQATLAAFRYLMQGSVAATFYLVGIGILYAATGTLNLDDMAMRLPEASAKSSIAIALCMIIAGVGLKAAIYPLHQWQPEAYSNAPDGVSAFMASTAGKIGIYIIMRIMFELFGRDVALKSLSIGDALIAAGVVALIVTSATAIKQNQLKKLFAYSSLAQVGAITIAVGTGSFLSLQAAMVYMAAHTLASAALFMAAGCMSHMTNKHNIDDLTGIAKTMPYSAAAITLAGLAVVGVPSSIMFNAKWMLLQSAIISPAAIIIIAAISAGTVMSAIYWWKVTSAIYTGGTQQMAHEAPLTMLLPCWVMVILCYYTGIDNSVITNLAAEAASILSGSGANDVAFAL